MSNASTKVIITATDYRKPAGTEGKIVSRCGGMFTIVFDQGFGVMTADQFELQEEGRT